MHHGNGKYMDAGTFKAELLLWVCLSRATPDELLEISKVIKYERELRRLIEKFGAYVPPTMKPVVDIAF